MSFTATTSNSAYPWRPDISVFAAQDVIPEALILQASVVSGAVEGDAPSVRVAYVNDDTAQFVAESNPIPEAEPDLASVDIFTGKISMMIRTSREQYFQAGTADQLSGSVSRALVRKCDEAFLTQAAPTPPAHNPPAGILTDPLVIDGGEVSASLDTLVDVVAEIQQNGGNPSHVIVAPDTWAQLRKLKTGIDYNSSLLGAGTVDAQPLLLGLPVLVNVAVPTLSGVVIDRNAVVSAVGAVNVTVSSDVYFASDDYALKATWRVGAALVRPDRVATFTVAADGS